jgi:2-oxo-4-hydroxy-4-carboxy-5-ureidoimidazoline decarboxylase
MSTPLAAFNALPAGPATKYLLSCCAAPAWASQVAGARPYSDLATALEVAERVITGLTWAEVVQALSRHPRIGANVTGASQEAGWSRREQAAVGRADDGVRAELAQANQEYEDRFGHIFLIFAAGRGPRQLLAEARRRLRNDPLAEQLEVRDELRKIALMRLERLIDELAECSGVPA